MSQGLFHERFGQADVDPRWTFYGVFEFAPTADRPSWVYVTSGHSNPWESAQEPGGPDDLSGAGVEFLLATAEQGDWAIRTLLDLLAFDLLLCAGRYPGSSPLGPGDRVPLRAPINGDEACLIRNVLATHTDDVWPGFALPSGYVRFLTLAGATDREVAHARTTSTDRLVEMLRTGGAYPVTDSRRSSMV